MCCGPYPTPSKRFFKLETLTSALEKMLLERDRFFYAELVSQLGNIPLATVEGDLQYEDHLRLVFAISATNRVRKRAALRLCVAKNHEEHSAALRKEFEALNALHPRAPSRIIKPLRPGNIYLPDRYRRANVNREVFAYFTEAFPGTGPLYVASDTQLGPKGPQPKRFSIADTEALKISIVRLIAACHNESTFDGLDPADLAAEHLAIIKQGKAAPEAFLLHCPRLRRRFRPDKMLLHLVFGALKSDRHALPLTPARPERLLEALTKVVGEDTARQWCAAMLKKAGHMDGNAKEDQPGRAYIDALTDCMHAL